MQLEAKVVEGQKAECRVEELQQILKNNNAKKTRKSKKDKKGKIGSNSSSSSSSSSSSDDEEYSNVTQTLRHLSLCHDVLIDPNNGKYNASSPDEQALVDGAASCGFKFFSKDNDGNIIVRVTAGD